MLCLSVGPIIARLTHKSTGDRDHHRQEKPAPKSGHSERSPPPIHIRINNMLFMLLSRQYKSNQKHKQAASVYTIQVNSTERLPWPKIQGEGGEQGARQRGARSAERFGPGTTTKGAQPRQSDRQTFNWDINQGAANFALHLLDRGRSRSRTGARTDPGHSPTHRCQGRRRQTQAAHRYIRTYRYTIYTIDRHVSALECCLLR